MTGFRLGCGQKKGEKLSPPGTRPTALVDAVTGPPPQGFGVRHYLHHFYHSPTAEEFDGSGAWYLLPPPVAQRRGLYACRCVTILGLLLLIAGAASIVVGYTWPHDGIESSIYKIAIFQDDEGNFYVPPEKLQEILKDPMRHWKTAGFCVFASGAVLMALSLLLPSLAHCCGSKRLAAFASEDATPNEAPVRIYPGGGEGKMSPSSGPVPVMEEISKVQPEERARTSSTADDLLLAESDDSHLIR